jgi:hypothetical protein
MPAPEASRQAWNESIVDFFSLSCQWCNAEAEAILGQL